MAPINGYAANNILRYSENQGSLQAFINQAPPGSTIVCESWKPLTLSKTIVIRKPLTLKGLTARLPEGLGRKELIDVVSENVTLLDLELHGNYDSVGQSERAALIQIQAGNFQVERCTFFDSTKDGVKIEVKRGASKDLVGGVVRDIKAFRMGRDAVSISGGTEGQKVRDVVVENVSLIKGYLRGPVEVSDGTDNIIVRNVYAEDCVYAVDVQDHRKECGANTNITIENVTAINCRHILRTANSPRGHANLTLRNLMGDRCERPLHISHTEGVFIDDLTITGHVSDKFPPVSIKQVQGLKLRNISTESAHFTDQSIVIDDCKDVWIEGVAMR